MAPCAALGVCLTVATMLAQSSTANGSRDLKTEPIAWLERYSRGEFEVVQAAMAAADEDALDATLAGLKEKAPAWIESGGLADRPRRRLAAATFALEAARAGEWNQWKLIQDFENMGSERRMVAPGVYSDGVRIVPASQVFWAAAPKLIEWACGLWREDAVPSDVERLWQLAAVAVAERSEDFEFLIGSPWEPRGNDPDEIEHLKHASARFPDERRFALAQGVAIDSRLVQVRLKGGAMEASKIFTSLADDRDVGAEASVRLAILRLRQREFENARKSAERAEGLTRDPFVRYLARYIRGRVAEEQKKTTEAERAYRAALVVMPRAQSASVGLAALLMSNGGRTEAASIVADAIRNPVPPDPWREYVHGDDRFWSDWLAELHALIFRGAKR